MHSVLCRLFDGRLIFPPVNEPKRILDCGFGAGDWALDVARAYPDCEVRQHTATPRETWNSAKGNTWNLFVPHVKSSRKVLQRPYCLADRVSLGDWC